MSGEPALPDWKLALSKVLSDWTNQLIVASPDVDGFLCAALVGSLRKAQIAAIYTTSALLLLDGASRRDLREALWLDHDISHPGVRCIGQHLVLHSDNDSLPLRHPVSFNPNIFYKQSFKNSFRGKTGTRRDKYPFGTIHFLMKGLGVEFPRRGSNHYHLLAHADGAWVTPLDYPANCRIWADTMALSDSIVDDLLDTYTTTTDNHRRHTRLVEDLISRGVARRGSRERASTRVPAEWQPLEGHQAITYRKGMDEELYLRKANDTLKYISDTSGWPIVKPRKVSAVIPGTVETPYPNAVEHGKFDGFMTSEKMFSHAFVSARELRYTKGIHLE